MARGDSASLSNPRRVSIETLRCDALMCEANAHGRCTDFSRITITSDRKCLGYERRKAVPKKKGKAHADNS